MKKIKSIRVQKNLSLSVEVVDIIHELMEEHGLTFTGWLLDDPRLVAAFKARGKDVPGFFQRLIARRNAQVGKPLKECVETTTPLPAFPWSVSIADSERPAGPCLVWNTVDLEDFAKCFIVTAGYPVVLKRTLMGWDVYRENGEFAAKMYLHPFDRNSNSNTTK